MNAGNASLAKITSPTLNRVYQRTRLFRWLDLAGRKPVTWIAGPPGCGKTTLVCSYIDSRELRCLWYQIDQGDTDIATFFYYMGLAAKKAAPHRRKRLPNLTPEYAGGLLTFARGYFRKLFSWLNTPFVLVFDNLQEVLPDSTLYAVLGEALGEIPEGGRIILISRNEPPPILARWQANQSMSVLGWADMQLTDQESNGIVRLMSGRKPHREELRLLRERAAGWVAGLAIIMELTRAEGIMPGQEILDEAVFNYFAGEIFDKLPRKTQDFLLQTSFLPRITVGTAIQLTGIGQAGYILTDLCRRHNFTEKFHHSETSYQYHSLFRQFLQTRAQRTLSQRHLSCLRQTAAALLKSDGLVEDAVTLMQESGDWEGLSQLICEYAPSLLGQGRMVTLEIWLKAIPQGKLEQSPWLLYWLGNCRLVFSPPEARRCLEKAFKLFQDNADPAGVFLAWSGVVDTFLYQWDTYAPLDDWIMVLEELLKAFPAFPSPAIEAHVTTSMLGALTFRQPQHPDIEKWVEKAVALTQEGTDVNLRVKTYIFLLAYYMWTGNFNKTAGVVEEATRLSKSKEATPFVVIASKGMGADYLWLNAAPEECLRAVSEGLAMAEATGIHLLDREILAYGAYGALTGGDLGTADDFLGKLASTLSETSRLDAAHFHYISGWAAAYRKDFERALEHGERAYSLAVTLGAPFQEAVTSISLAQVHTERGEYRLADACLGRSYKIGRAIKSVHLEHLCALVEAWLAMRQLQERRCLVALSKAMALGRQHGYRNNPWWLPATMTRLCLKALEYKIEVPYVRELIRKRGLFPEEPPLHIDNWPWTLRVSTLGNFEIITEGQQLQFGGKAWLKPLELLKTLVSFGSRNVGRERLTDALWPDAEGDGAVRAFDTTLHRLRKLLGNDKVLIMQGGRLSLNPILCWLDVWSLQYLLDTLEASLKSHKVSAQDIERVTEKAFSLYRGPFLVNEDQRPWLLQAGQRFRSQFTRLLLTISGYWEQEGQWHRAADIYRRGLELDEFGQGIRRRLEFCDEAYLSGLKSKDLKH